MKLTARAGTSVALRLHMRTQLLTACLALASLGCNAAPSLRQTLARGAVRLSPSDSGFLLAYADADGGTDCLELPLRARASLSGSVVDVYPGGWRFEDGSAGGPLTAKRGWVCDPARLVPGAAAATARTDEVAALVLTDGESEWHADYPLVSGALQLQRRTPSTRPGEVLALQLRDADGGVTPLDGQPPMQATATELGRSPRWQGDPVIPSRPLPLRFEDGAILVETRADLLNPLFPLVAVEVRGVIGSVEASTCTEGLICEPLPATMRALGTFSLSE